MKPSIKVSKRNWKWLILGQGRHGKDTVAELIVKYLPMYKFQSSSEAALRVIKPALLATVYKDLSMEGYYNLDTFLFNDRVNHREAWAALISLYNANEPSALAELILSQADIYVGMRSQREFEASVQLFDFVIEVDASERVTAIDPTYCIYPYDAALVFRIENNGTKEELELKVKMLVEELCL